MKYSCLVAVIPVGGRQVAGTCRTVVGRAAEGKTVGALHEFLDREQSSNSLCIVITGILVIIMYSYIQHSLSNTCTSILPNLSEVN